MTDPNPAVSVVIPHFSDLAGLDRCLSALARQTLAPAQFEVIVADNGSPCGREAVERAIAGRARLVIEPDKGAGPARNKGVAAALAPLLAFTDADCLPDARWLEAGLAVLATKDFAGGAMQVLVGDGARMSGAEAFETLFAFDNRAYVTGKGFSVTANLFVPRALFDRVGPFRTGVSEDFDWCRRAASAGFRIAYAPDAIVGHPARKDWPELRRKWRRLMAESKALDADRKGARLRWLGRTWLLPLSVVPHAAKVLAPGNGLPDMRTRLAALATLVRLRLWRFAEGHRLLLQQARPT